MAKVPKDKRKSVSGTNITGGIISLEEYNRKLTGKAGLDIYDEMRRSDGTTSAALRIVKLPIQSATWQVKAASDDTKDIEAADKLQHNLDYLGWKTILREILLYLDFGFSVFEKVLDVIPYENGDYIGISQLASLKQTTIKKWEQKDGSAGIEQLATKGADISLPLESLIIFTNDKEGENHEGRPLLRPSYKHWYMKETFYKVVALAVEKQGLGIPYLEVPAGAVSGDEDKAEEIARNIRSNEAAYAKMPEGFKLTFMDMMAKALYDPMPIINHHTAQIMKSILAQFLELSQGGSNSGSNALSSDQSELFMKSEEATADYIREQINRFFIPDFMALNYPNAKANPTIEYSELSDSDNQTLADSVSKLMNSGAVSPDAELENHLRDVYDLPDLPDDVYDNYDTRVLPKATPSPTDTQASFKQTIESLDRFIEASINDSKKRRTPKR